MAKIDEIEDTEKYRREARWKATWNFERPKPPPELENEQFFLRRYFYERVKRVIEWEWNTTWGHWVAEVEFSDGYISVSHPARYDYQRQD